MSTGIKAQTKLLSAQILMPYLQNVLQRRKLEAKGKENVNDKWGGEEKKKQTLSLLGKIKRRRRTLHI